MKRTMRVSDWLDCGILKSLILALKIRATIAVGESIGWCSILPRQIEVAVNNMNNMKIHQVLFFPARLDSTMCFMTIERQFWLGEEMATVDVFIICFR